MGHTHAAMQCLYANGRSGSLPYSEQDIPAGEELFRIPLLLGISAWDTGGFLSSMEEERMVTDGHKVPAHIFVATKCLREMALPDSPRQPYFQACFQDLDPVLSAAFNACMSSHAEQCAGLAQGGGELAWLLSCRLPA